LSDATLLTAAELSAGYAAKKFSPLEIVQDLLAHTHRVNVELNALYIIDDERALHAARASTNRWIRRAPLDALDGVPTTIKDALPSIGNPSYRGSAAHAADTQIFDSDAPVVARMREAGMVFLGKTTMPDFGILPSGCSSKHGVTRNPWNTDRTTGGSSAGAAASIAAGINPVAIGTDIVGSIRLPASFTGIFGFKPSQGRVPYYFPNNPSLVAGPMSRTVLDAALLMNVATRRDHRDFTALAPNNVDYIKEMERNVTASTIGVVTSLGFGVEPDADVTAAIEDMARKLDAAGHKIVRQDATFSSEDLREAERFYKVRCRAEFLTMPAHRQLQADVIAAWSAEADTMSATAFYRAFNRLQKMREATVRLMDGCDFLILPSVPKVAFRAEQPGFGPDTLFAPWINTFLFNLSEQPASSIPCGLSREGLPIGLQIVGKRFADADVFGFSARVEALFPMHEEMNRVLQRWRA
jgi:aspartyl-tRNA(Asn)/glutamyl-tRNA(Gln) amidotransferase subunit A